MANIKIKSLYIHYPFCQHLCNYCDFYKKIPKSDEELDHFESHLVESIKIHNGLMENYGYTWDEALETLYLGGGTPSLWGRRGALFLKQQGFLPAREREWTLEVNPGKQDTEGIEYYQEWGINRFSIGVQSFRAKFLKMLDRVHGTEEVQETLSYFQKKGANMSVDIMLGLPFSDKRDVIEELKNILSYEPHHLSVYILTVKSNYKHYDGLPKEERVAEEFLSVSEFLRACGYNHYEVSNFARPGFESKHNLRYWRSQTTAALGPSATGLFTERGIRYKWKSVRPEYNIEILSKESRNMEKIYLQLRMRNGITEEMTKSISPLIDRWRKRGYLEKEGEKIILGPKGFLMIDSLMDDFFNHELTSLRNF